MLLEEFLKPMGLSQRSLAAGIRVPYQRVNEIVKGRPGVTPSSALRVLRFTGREVLQQLDAVVDVGTKRPTRAGEV